MERWNPLSNILFLGFGTSARAAEVPGNLLLAVEESSQSSGTGLSQLHEVCRIKVQNRMLSF
jgi:hypothetical protein